MTQNSNDKEKIDPLVVVLTIIGVVLVFSLLAKLFKEVKENTDSDIISDEGQEVLGDKNKREKLRSAVDQYHREGNWDGLEGSWDDLEENGIELAKKSEEE